jgi:hypothetical protein
VGACPLHGGREGVTNVAGWDTAPPVSAPAPPAGDGAPHITGSSGDGQVQPAAVARRAARQIPPETAQNGKTAPAPETPKKEDKPGILRRLLKVFK